MQQEIRTWDAVVSFEVGGWCLASYIGGWNGGYYGQTPDVLLSAIIHVHDSKKIHFVIPSRFTPC